MTKDILYPLRRLHGYIYEWNEKNKRRNKLKKEFNNNPKTVFLIMTPEHGNIGDHAIALAETKLLSDLGYNIIELTEYKLNAMRLTHQLDEMNGFPIIFNGGGNLGTIWPHVEVLTREVLNKNRKSKIIVLPNTIYYEQDSAGQHELKNSIKIYNRNKQLYLYAREKTSYELMRNIYKNVKLMPDMVLSMKPYSNNSIRKGCLLCLRQDVEKTRSVEEENLIFKQAEDLFPGDVKDTDMIAKHNIMPSEREKAVKSKMDEFCNAELVITDRLHGMIFCAITGTPCIVINSKSPKVLGCYEWIKDLEYIRVANDVTDIETEYRKIPKKQYKYNNDAIQHYFNELGKDILEILSK